MKPLVADLHYTLHIEHYTGVGMAKQSKLWGGRFQKPTDPLVERFTSSIAVDWRLARYDVEGSIAHAKMLGRCGIITPVESRRLILGLSRLGRAIARCPIRWFVFRIHQNQRCI